MSESSDHNHSDSHGHGESKGRLGYDPFPQQLTEIGNFAWLVGAIGLVLLAIFFFFDHGHAFRSLLLAFHVFLIISLGSLGFVMISHLTGGGWGAVIRRFGEAAFMNVPLMFVFFLVLSLGYKYLFPWAHIEDFKPDKVAYEVLGKRAMLYTWWPFTLRTTLYFAIWYALGSSLRAGSLRLDRGPDLVLRRKMRLISAGGMVLFFVTTTGYALDYIQARETCWYSSIGGFIAAIGIGIAGMSFMSLNVCYFARIRPIKDILIPQHTNDLGNILLALVILFMYTNFAQYLIQWNGNMPEDYYYFTYRGLGTVYNGWRYITLFLLIFEFFVPFFLLLMKPLKRNTKTFAQIAGLLLFMQLMYSCWLFIPSMAHRVGFGGSTVDPSGGHFYLTDLFALAGVGGIWLSSYIKRLSTQPLLALNVADQPEIVTNGTPAHA
jgi:hypothetical protein